MMHNNAGEPDRSVAAVDSSELRREYRARRGEGVTALDGVSIRVEQGRCTVYSAPTEPARAP
ncbi:hypothetical protein ACFQZC_27730 [Streptacidiphilus monticola]